ncbi:MAG: hypothetical protein UZ22_OP11002000775 [Microgenomates bacterium OLB23]|nr:MAG: hypothetical protein UZ22_OP11002000775 [Microgenomates bacterium OLB23]
MNGVNDIFGDPIKAPGPAGLNSGTVPETISRAFSFALNFVFVVAGFILAVQLIWGGLDWVTSGGNDEKLATAQAKIVNSLIGIIIMIAALVIWVFIASNILGTIKYENGGIRFNLPSINNGGVVLILAVLTLAPILTILRDLFNQLSLAQVVG